MAGAAFFDLDRTLLSGASSTVYERYLRDAGLLGRGLPGGSVFNKIYEVLGENRLFMAASQQLGRVMQGWPVERVREAGALAVDALNEVLHPFARPLFAEHKAAGRKVVLATTTPYELVKPFADLLGFDDVVATRYTVDSSGAFDGTFDGGFVWGAGKLAAVQEWAERHGVSLAESFAYSDSFFDRPLLSAVGNPVAVNPDPRLLAFATVRRWPVVNLDKPDGVPKLLGIEPQQVLHQFFRPELIRYARIDIRGVEHIPKRGPAIIALNHRSYFDVIAAGCAIAKAGRPVRVLAKKEMFEAPVLGPIIKSFGTIRVDRGTGSNEPLERAAYALEHGEIVAIFPQGTIPRGDEFFDPELKGRPGVARLAAMTDAPIVPVGIWGSEKVWPRDSKLPNFFNVLNPPEVTVTVGAPFTLDETDVEAGTKHVMHEIMRLLPQP